jgi:hypothetical protein
MSGPITGSVATVDAEALIARIRESIQRRHPVPESTAMEPSRQAPTGSLDELLAEQATFDRSILRAIDALNRQVNALESRTVSLEQRLTGEMIALRREIGERLDAAGREQREDLELRARDLAAAMAGDRSTVVINRLSTGLDEVGGRLHGVDEELVRLAGTVHCVKERTEESERQYTVLAEDVQRQIADHFASLERRLRADARRSEATRARLSDQVDRLAGIAEAVGLNGNHHSDSFGEAN